MIELISFDKLLICLILLVPIAFFTTYGIAVFNEHVDAGFPYISDTGTLPYESCVFGQFLDLGAFILSYNISTNNLLTRLNKWSLLISIISAFGTTVVGNFQETNVIEVHLIGAVLAFLGLHIYCWIQVHISKKLSFQLYNSKRIYSIRIFNCVLGLVNLLFTGIFGLVSRAKFNGPNKLKWRPEDGGFAEHVISTANEWSLCIVTMLTLLTFLPDFKNLNVEHKVFKTESTT